MPGSSGLSNVIQKSRFLCWLVPACVFAVSGGTKLGQPMGTPPDALGWLWRLVSYSQALLLLGLLEVGVGILLSFRQLRRLGSFIGLFLLTGLATVVALSAGDYRFARDCGCMPAPIVAALPCPESDAWYWPHLAFDWMLWMMLLEGVLPRVAAGRAEWTRVGSATVLGGGFALCLLGLAVEALAIHTESQTHALDFEPGASRLLGRPLPEFDVIGPAGKSLRSSSAIPGGSHVVFFSPNCPRCHEYVPRWRVWAGTTGSASPGSLVLVSVGTSEATTSFVVKSECSDLIVYRLGRLDDLRRLRIGFLPYGLIIDRECRVEFFGSIPER